MEGGVPKRKANPTDDDETRARKRRTSYSRDNSSVVTTCSTTIEPPIPSSSSAVTNFPSIRTPVPLFFGSLSGLSNTVHSDVFSAPGNSPNASSNLVSLTTSNSYQALASRWDQRHPESVEPEATLLQNTTNPPEPRVSRAEPLGEDLHTVAIATSTQEEQAPTPVSLAMVPPPPHRRPVGRPKGSKGKRSNKQGEEQKKREPGHLATTRTKA